jgi:hypothetical protein
VFLDEFLDYAFFNSLKFVKYGKRRRRYNLFYGIKLAFVLLMQKGKLETQ